METLALHLESLQDELLTLYETGSVTLVDQIRHWLCLRRENAIMYLARKNGVKRIGMHAVPPQSVSQEKAREAIEMHLTLCSLQESEFANEPWSLADTCWERWISQPSRCFKKAPQQVEVRYDGCASNLMLYTAWGQIYYQDNSNTWTKTHSEVDKKGIFFRDRGVRRYYVDFSDDARRFSNKGYWEVDYNGELLSSLDLVTSTTPHFDHRGPTTGACGRCATHSADPGGSPLIPRSLQWQAEVGPGSGSDRPDTTSLTSEGEPKAKRRRGEGARRRLGSVFTSGGGSSHASQSPHPTKSPQPTNCPQSTECAQPPGGSWPPGCARSSEPAQLSSQPTEVRGSNGPARSVGLGGSDRPSAKGPARKRRAAGAVLSARPGSDRTRCSAPREAHCPPPCNSPRVSAPASACAQGPEASPSDPSPAEGQLAGHPRQARPGVRQAAEGHQRGPGHILRDSGDSTPVLAALAGPSNPLKCFRYRCQQNHRHRYGRMSTVWYWVGENGPERAGPARVLVYFNDREQQQNFVENVPLPNGCSFVPLM
nr:MAG: E2 protein [Leptonychotes weddellii papillomavirus 10]